MHPSRPMSHGPIWPIWAAACLLAAPFLAAAQPCPEHLEPLPTEVFPSYSQVYSLVSVPVGPGGPAALYAQGWQLRPQIGDSVGRWDGSRWLPLQGGATVAEPERLFVADDGSGPALYGTGWFYFASISTGANVARWDGAEWSPLGPDLRGNLAGIASADAGDGHGSAIYAFGSDLYLSGDPTVRSNLFRWDGAQWSSAACQTCLGGQVSQIISVDHDAGGPGLSTLYASYAVDGPSPNGRIARLVDSQWEEIGSISTAQLAAYRDGARELLLTGAFQTWDGAQWEPLETQNEFPAGFQGFAYTTADEDGHSTVYVVGSSPSNSRVAVLRQGVWSLIETPISYGYVATITAYDDGQGDSPSIYIGGRFHHVGSLPANGLARTDGCAPPCPVDHDLNGVVSSGDIARFLTFWTLGITDPNYRPVADFNADDLANSGDISAFLTAWIDVVTNGC